MRGYPVINLKRKTILKKVGKLGFEYLFMIPDILGKNVEAFIYSLIYYCM